MLVMTNTGIQQETDVPSIPGFACITCRPRPYMAKDGGVAVYAKPAWAKRMTVVADHPEFGLAWVCVEGFRGRTPLYICACYVPHEDSNYYLLEQGNLCKERHLERLTMDVLRFKAQGLVLLAGDFNARTGGLDDTGGPMATADELRAAGIDLPGGEVQELAMRQSIPPRRSADRTHNKLGEQVVRLCVDSGMIILNGRLPGDRHGQFTFFADGREGKSCIDYFVATPELVVCEPRQGRWSDCTLHVTPRGQCPPRPCEKIQGGVQIKQYFDHMPCMLTLSMRSMQGADLAPGGLATPTARGRSRESAKGSASLRWSDDMQCTYAQVLANHPDLAGLRELASNADAPSVCTNEQALIQLIKQAASLTGHAGTHKALKKGGPGNTAPQNGWYNAECKEARAHLHSVQRRCGEDSEQAVKEHIEYKKLVRRTKRAWDRAHMFELQAAMHADPKVFWRAYGGTRRASPLMDVDEWSTYFSELYSAKERVGSGSTADQDLIFHAAEAGRVVLNDSLSKSFTRAEIEYVLSKFVARGKSAGLDGIPGEFLRYAYLTGPDGSKYHLLSASLKVIFDRVLKDGYPEHWAASALVPVPKPKGNVQEKDDHRGIAVGSAISKVFAICMMHRIDRWAEANHFRAEGQSGFRSHKGTTDAAFVLNHIVTAYHARKKPVFVAFVDFKKAYDWVDRELLWKCLESLGMDAACLRMLKSMYASVSLQVRIGNQLGVPFQSEAGVKQGDPLSPLLFGLFIDKIEEFLKVRFPNIGVTLLHKIIQVLLYADDLAMMAETAEEMQHLLDGLLAFCRATGMQVSIKKSEIVVFNMKFCPPQERAKAATLHYDGHVLVLKPSFIYLGIIMADGTPRERMACMYHATIRKARAAAHLMFRRCYTMGIHTVGMQCHLFDTLVKPILNYGCEIWAPYLLSLGNISCKHEVELWHRAVLRQSLGVASSTSGDIMLDELGRDPLCFTWLRLVLRFWNKTCRLREGCLLKMAMQESLQLGKSAGGWLYHLNAALQNLGCSAQLSSMQAVDVEECMGQARLKWTKTRPSYSLHQQVRDIPDTDRAGYKFIKYQKWFASVAGTPVSAKFVNNLFYKDQIHVVSKFRMGVHWLNSECLRKVKEGRMLKVIPRSGRLCPCCDAHAPEDERHMMECSHYRDIRLRYSSLFGVAEGDWQFRDDDHMRQVMNGDGSWSFWNKFANFLLACKRRRERLVNTGRVRG